MASKKLLYAVAFTCFLYAAVAAFTMIKARAANPDAVPDVITLGFVSLASIGVAAIYYAHMSHKPRAQLHQEL